MRFRRKLRTKLCTKMLRGLGPLMGLLAIGAPLFAEPLAVWNRTAANAAEGRLTIARSSDASRFFHPLVTLLSLAAARTASCHQAQTHPSAILGWDAQTRLRGSIWMVRDHWMSDRRPPAGTAMLTSLLRC